MMNTRREFTPEFKREAVALLKSSGRPLMQIAAELGIAPSMLRNWRSVVHDGSRIEGCRTVSWLTKMPRAASSSSTMSRVTGNREYSEIASLIVSAGRRWWAK